MRRLTALLTTCVVLAGCAGGDGSTGGGTTAAQPPPASTAPVEDPAQSPSPDPSPSPYPSPEPSTAAAGPSGMLLGQCSPGDRILGVPEDVFEEACAVPTDATCVPAYYQISGLPFDQAMGKFDPEGSFRVDATYLDEDGQLQQLDDLVVTSVSGDTPSVTFPAGCVAPGARMQMTAATDDQVFSLICVPIVLAQMVGERQANDDGTTSCSWTFPTDVGG